MSISRTEQESRLAHPSMGRRIRSVESAHVWRSPDDGLWVGTLSGEFLGMVERKDERFVATGPFGEDLGVEASLLRAQRRILARVIG